MIQWSILICSLTKRSEQLESLKKELNKQIDYCGQFAKERIEILVEVDDKQKSTGEKRNILLRRAKGTYISFIDDDDHVLDGYINLILNAMFNDADCISIRGHYSVNNGAMVLWELSKDNIDEDSFSGREPLLLRRTNHLAPVKRTLALMAMFPDKSNAEDKEYSERLNPHLKTEASVKKPIYHYDYKTDNKEY